MSGEAQSMVGVRLVRRGLRKGRSLVSRVVDAVAQPRRRVLQPSLPLSEQLDAPLIAWLNYHHHKVLGSQCTWLGHKALKNPLDAWIYQEILVELKPDVVIEIGNKFGGSTLFLASIMDMLGHGQVLALDVNHSRFTAHHPRIELVTGDCSSPEIVSRVRERCSGKSVLVIHDADHSRAAVARDLNLYGPLVTRGSYLIVEDSVQGIPGFSSSVNRSYGDFALPDHDSPLQGVADFLAAHPEFEVDARRERYILTANPLGFLRRVR